MDCLRRRLASATQFAAAFHQNYAVQHRNAKQSHESYKRGNGKIQAGQRQGKETADGRKRHHQQNQKREPARIERDEEQKENRCQGDRNDDGKQFYTVRRDDQKNCLREELVPGQIHAIPPAAAQSLK